MISSFKVATDAAKLPIAFWTETRGIGSGGGPGEVDVECRIMKDASGELLFVARGPKRQGYGSFEHGRPWRQLRAFSLRPAQQLYATTADRHLWEKLAGKSIAARTVLQDGAHVLLAEFYDALPIHINETVLPEAQFQELHAALKREFFDKRNALVELCPVEQFKWPQTDDRVETYIAERAMPSRAGSKLMSFVDKSFAAVLLAGFAGLIAWAAWRLYR